jgi:murein DD-endopeptidase MepM/ murein hydrolase activator NlpD
MNGRSWLWVALGSLTAWLFFSRRRTALGSPVYGQLQITPRGWFGARRPGPPAHRHQGIDIAATRDSFVLAVGDGIIIEAKPGLGGVVRKLKLDAPGAWTWNGRRVCAVVYADLGVPFAEPGDRVRRGDPIGQVGDANFFHFAVKAADGDGEVFIDPSDAGFPVRPGLKVI